ncbi:MAG TPA: hypothetical protein VI583_06805 [Cyclobacteriaceae bacterium]|nr:hypothetical protein [Cyclobacteriaceae bacterium]
MKNYASPLLLPVIAFLLLACDGRKTEQTYALQITIRENIIGSMDIGIGWNDATAIEGRWVKHEMTEDDWDRYFGLMEWSGCHWLRHAAVIPAWEPVNDNNDPENTDFSKFTFDSEDMQKHYRFLEQAEKRNIKVLFANWRLETRWMTKQQDNWNKAHPDNEEEFAEAIAAVIYHLTAVKKFRSVWALSLWNEPNGDWAYLGPKSNYPESFWPLYAAVDKHLKRLGVRERILMLGPDTSTGGKPEHIPGMLEMYPGILDIICDHDYSAFRGERMDRSIAAYYQLMNDLTKVPGKKLPFVIGEFGNYGAGSQAVDDDVKVYDGALSTVTYLIRMLNHGAAGLARWEFHTYGDSWRNFGALTSMDSNYVFKPYGPVFYPHAITARYVKPGWKVREYQAVGTTDGTFTTVLTSERGDQVSVLMLNDTEEPRSILLKSDIPYTVLHHLSVTGPIPAGIDLHDDLKFRSKGVKVLLPPRSITALTNVEVGDLSLPEKLSLRRMGGR